jgi:hypothetical protein
MRPPRRARDIPRAWEVDWAIPEEGGTSWESYDWAFETAQEMILDDCGIAYKGDDLGDLYKKVQKELNLNAEAVSGNKERERGCCQDAPSSRRHYPVTCGPTESDRLGPRTQQKLSRTHPARSPCLQRIRHCR